MFLVSDGDSSAYQIFVMDGKEKIEIKRREN